MSYVILKRKENQQIARPYNKADNADEVVELLEHHIKVESRNSGVSEERLAQIIHNNLDTETPILQCDDGRVRFYAFTPEVF